MVKQNKNYSKMQEEQAEKLQAKIYQELQKIESLDQTAYSKYTVNF